MPPDMTNLKHFIADELYSRRMNTVTARAFSVWKAADAAASDAEALVRLQTLKYAEGIAGPPMPRVIRQSEQLRHRANDALITTIELLASVQGLRHQDAPHVLACTRSLP
jgi:hypothetical protein